jgi:ERF superfamily protein
MPQSSESVAALASALAKAQAELINPEKSLTATIRTGRLGERERSFRYAPLSSGLDIVRKTLGQHEIATLQTTAIDQTAGMVHLTTTLAHASGEWIASDWPVCPIADTANPQRMGAALTYARRYALFTLVGIAGEDDLDAPNLCDGPLSAAERPFKPMDNGSRMPLQTPSNEHARDGRKGGVPITLDPEQSAALREKLLTDLGTITSADLAAAWAREALTAKNSLTLTDAKLVEDAFERRLSELSSSEAATPSNDNPSVPQVGGPQVIATAESTDAGQAKGIDKSILTVAAPRRYRNREHLRYVAQQACLAAASPQTLTISVSPSPVHSAARSAMSSRSHSAAGIIVRCIAHVTSARGGGRQALTRSRLPAGSGKRRAEWDSGGPNDRHYLGRMVLPCPLTQLQRTRTSAPPQRRKKKLPYRMFPASRGKRLDAPGS